MSPSSHQAILPARGTSDKAVRRTGGDNMKKKRRAGCPKEREAAEPAFWLLGQFFMTNRVQYCL